MNSSKTKSAPAKATKKAATTTKKVAPAQKKPTQRKSTAASKKVASKSAAAKTVSSAPKAAQSKPQPTVSPVRSVENIEQSDSQFNAQWIMVLVLVFVFIAGVAWWSTRETISNNKVRPVQNQSSSAEFKPSVRVIEN